MKNLKKHICIVFKYGKFKILFAFFLMLIVSICGLLQPKLIQYLIDKAIPNKQTNLLLGIVFIYFSISIIIYIIRLILQYFYSTIKRTITIWYKNSILIHLTRLNGHYLLNKKTGELLKIIDDDLFNIENIGIETIFSLISQFITATCAIIILAFMQPVALIVVVFIEIFEIFFQYNFSKKISLQTAKIRNTAGEMSSILEEYISNIINIIFSKCKSIFWKKILVLERNFKNQCINLDMKIELSTLLSNLFHVITILSIYLLGGYWVINDKMSIGGLIVYIEYVNMVTGPILNIIRSNSQIQQVIVSINKVYELLDEPIKTNYNVTGYIPQNISGKIKFESVSFSYDTNQKILDNLTIEFYPNLINAVVGESGCGKSTILKLLYRLWELDSGDILLDNISIKKYNLYYLRREISIITQDVLVFNDTIWNNIRCNQKVSERKIKEICIATGVEEFVNKLDKKYDTVVGERGATLSGGQKQKLAIARVLLADKKVIVLDEATSALDNISQYNIINNIKPYISNKTVIIIAHRLSIVKNADIIYVMKNGKCIDNGKHELLIKNCLEYQKLIQTEKNLELH